VKSCENSEFKLKKDKFKGFEVILEDTILFPEGGGQVLTNNYPQNSL